LAYLGPAASRLFSRHRRYASQPPTRAMGRPSICRDRLDHRDPATPFAMPSASLCCSFLPDERRPVSKPCSTLNGPAVVVTNIKKDGLPGAANHHQRDGARRIGREPGKARSACLRHVGEKPELSTPLVSALAFDTTSTTGQPPGTYRRVRGANCRQDRTVVPNHHGDYAGSPRPRFTLCVGGRASRATRFAGQTRLGSAVTVARVSNSFWPIPATWTIAVPTSRWANPQQPAGGGKHLAGRP